MNTWLQRVLALRWKLPFRGWRLIGGIALTVAAQAQTITLQYNVEYKCGGERIVVAPCHSDSDRPGYPATSPSQDYCTVYYPDRPKRNGMTAISTELRSEIVKKMQACGALAASQGKSAQPSGPGSSAQAYLAEGDKYRDAKDYDRAIETYKKVIALSPDSETLAGAYFRIGALYNFLKRYAEAVAPLREAVRLKPDLPLANYGLGNAYHNLKQYPEAVAAFQRALQLKPGEVTYLYMLGLSYAAMGNQSEALQTAKTLEAKNSTGFANLLYDRINELSKQARQSNVPANTSAAALADQGWKYYDAKDYSKAVEACKKALALDPRNVGAFNVLGLAYSGLNRYPDATAALQHAISLKPAEGLYRYNLGLAYYSAGDDAKAIDAFRAALALKLDSELSAKAHREIGLSYYRLKHYDLAVSAHRQSLALKPDDPPTLCDLGAAYFVLKQYPEAEAVLQQSLRLKSDQIWCNYYLGWIYNDQKKYAEAVTRLREEVRLSPSYANASLELGYAYMQLKRYPEAVAALQQAIRLKSDYAMAHYYLGITYFSMGRKDDAQQVYKALQTIDKAQAQKLYEEINKPTKSQPAGTGVDPADLSDWARNVPSVPAKSTAQSGTPSARQGSQPTTALDYLKLGDKYLYETKDYAKAIEAYKKGLALNPDKVNVANGSNSLGVAYYRLKQYSDAVPAYLESLRLKPDPVVYANLGMSYAELKQYDKAVEAYREAVRLKPDFVDAEYRLGAAYFNLKNYAESAAAFQQAIHQNAMNFSQYPDSVTAFEQAVRLKPNDAELQYDLGWAYVVFKQYEKAIPPLNEALRLKPDYAEASSQLASAYFGSHQFSKAIPVYEQAIRSNPKPGADYYNLGNCYIAMGKNDEAMKVYDRLKPVDKSWADMLFKEITLISEADKGEPDAQNTLGFRYENGLGRFPKDNAEAIKWYTRAAHQGWGAAQHNLCGFYTKPMDLFKGADGPIPLPKINANRQDIVEAIGWCSKAAEQQFAESQYKLILLYAKGSADIKPDYEKAYFWLCVRRDPADLREKVGKQVSEAKRTENESLAKLWKPTKTAFAAKP